MTGEIYGYHKPILGLWLWTQYDGRPDCWVCDHIRVGRFPSRVCPKRPEVYIWAGAYEEEDKEKAAQSCQYYVLRKELNE